MAETDCFVEYRSISITEPLRQGDVVERVADDATAWNRHLLVMTADCDFAHGKHQGRVTCVPLLTKDEYLLELHVPKFRHQVAQKLVDALQKALADLGTNGISEKRLRDWPSELSTSAILTSLAIPDNAREAIGGMLDAIRELGSDTPSLADATAVLIRAQRRLPRAQSEKNLSTQLVERLRSAFKQPPGDALFLSALAAGHDDGYFVYLRHLEQIWEPQVSLGPSRSVVAYRRLSRLQDKYTHAIAQRFALVYMAIGLPNAYEEMRDLHADLLEEEIL